MRGLKELEIVREEDCQDWSAKKFSDFVCKLLNQGELLKEVMVNDRGDGRRGRVDLVYLVDGLRIGIELDRFYPRKKSIIKLRNLELDEMYVVTRSPITIHKVIPTSSLA